MPRPKFSESPVKLLYRAAFIIPNQYLHLNPRSSLNNMIVLRLIHTFTPVTPAPYFHAEINQPTTIYSKRPGAFSCIGNQPDQKKQVTPSHTILPAFHASFFCCSPVSRSHPKRQKNL